MHMFFILPSIWTWKWLKRLWNDLLFIQRLWDEVYKGYEAPLAR